MSNVIGDRGPGRWTIVTYNPLRAIGPIRGFLDVDQKFHTIYHFVKNKQGHTEKRHIFTCSSLNVAYAVNENFFKEQYALPDTTLSGGGSAEINPDQVDEPEDDAPSFTPKVRN